MKIDGNNASLETKAADATRRSGAVDAGTRRVADSKAPSGGDRVELSSDVALAAAALKAANKVPDIRTELVDRMREKLAKGEVGNDAYKLADAMIDDLLKP